MAKGSSTATTDASGAVVFTWNTGGTPPPRRSTTSKWHPLWAKLDADLPLEMNGISQWAEVKFPDARTARSALDSSRSYAARQNNYHIDGFAVDASIWVRKMSDAAWAESGRRRGGSGA